MQNCNMDIKACITLSSRAALGLPAFRPSASREQRYLAYNIKAYAKLLNCRQTKVKEMSKVLVIVLQAHTV